MSTDIVIRPAAIGDVYALARDLRAGDRAEVASVGKEPRRVLRAARRSSLMPAKVALVDGAIAAMWGLSGEVLSETGEPWLMTATPCDRVKVSFLRIARAELALMLAIKPRLENYVAADYPKAVRLLAGLGFTIEAPQPVGPKHAPFRRFWIEA